MDSAPAAPPSGNGTKPIRWYSRAALDGFLDSATQERARLETVIADANARLARANSAVGLHQTMLEMLLESQREIRAIRQNAEAEAAEIIARGDAEAEAALRVAPARSTNGAGSANGSGSTNGSGSPNGAAPSASERPADPSGVPGVDSPEDADFFAYLKGALDGRDERGPLGND